MSLDKLGITKQGREEANGEVGVEFKLTPCGAYDAVVKEVVIWTNKFDNKTMKYTVKLNGEDKNLIDEILSVAQTLHDDEFYSNLLEEKVGTTLTDPKYYRIRVTNYIKKKEWQKAADDLKESSETNNTASAIINVHAAQTKDLVVEYLRINPVSAQQGGTVTVYYRVRNLGTTDVSRFTLRLYLSFDNNITTSDTYLN